MYSHEAYKIMPSMTLLISGQQVTFLFNSRATESVVHCNDLIPKPKLSSRHMKTIEATGNTVKEKYTVPLQVEDDVNGKFKH